MTKKKTTKRALLASALSLILCFSMLLGTTYAWFTDSVTSANNKIVAGNLDVELHYWNGSEYVNITEESDPIFGEGSIAQDVNGETLWEPGKTQVAFLKIVNKGSLALRYTVGLKVQNVAKDLYKAMQYTITPDAVGGGALPTWDAAAAKSVVPGMQLVSNGEGEMAKGSEHFFALSIHMKEEAGNEYQDGQVNFDLTVLATQLASEFDSFDNQYDKEAAWDGVVPAQMPDTLVVDGATQTVHVKDAEAFAYLSTLSAKWAEFYSDGNGVEYTNYANGAGSNYYYSGQWTVSLESDINLLNHPIDPVVIMFGQGTGATAFKGNNHVIRNVNAKTGLFANNTRASYSDLILENVHASNGALTGSANTDIVNVTVKNASISGVDYVGGVVGYIYGDVIGCKVIDSSVVGTKEVGGLIGFIDSSSGDGVVKDNAVRNVTVFANNRAAGLVAQANVGVKVYNNTVDTAIVEATDTSKYQPGAIISNDIVPANIYDNTYENVVVKGGASTSMGGSDLGVQVPDKVELPEDAKFESTEPVIDAAGGKITISDASFKDANGNEVDLTTNTEPITVTLDATGFADGTQFDVYHDAEYVATATVSGGKVSYECLHFCEIVLNKTELTPVGTADELIAALEKGEGVIFTADIKIDPAGMSNAYGATGINVKNGQTINGNGFTLDIKGAGGTWDSGINTTGGIIRNLKVTGSFRGIFINHNSTHSEKVVLENVIIEGTTYTISCDQGLNQGIEAYNCTFNGWTSYAATVGNAKFVNCSFGRGNGYAYLRPYSASEFVGCSFASGYVVDPRAAVVFDGCSFGGETLTAENVASLVSGTEKVTVK